MANLGIRNGKIDEEMQDTIYMMSILGFNGEEIAQELGVTSGAVYYRRRKMGL